ncbi:MAG: anti-sigma factor, partial [Gemmatimonadales bacterium]
MNDQWTDRLSEYLDGELPAAERAALEAHLATCADCRDTAAELRTVVARAQALEDRPPARDLWPELRARMTPGRGAGGSAPRRLSFSVP